MQFAHRCDLQITSSSEGISRAESTSSLRIWQFLASRGPTTPIWSVSTHGERFRFSLTDDRSRSIPAIGPFDLVDRRTRNGRGKRAMTRQWQIKAYFKTILRGISRRTVSAVSFAPTRSVDRHGICEQATQRRNEDDATTENRRPAHSLIKLASCLLKPRSGSITI